MVRDFLSTRFERPLLRLSAAAYRDFLLHLPDHGVSGGACYDALVAATAAGNGVELVTCDQRASPIYQRYGVRVQRL